MNTLIIEKDGTISEKQIKTLDKLYSVCGYRTNKDFEKLYEWNFDENVYELYGKKSGKKDKENHFKLPINDSYKYYGSLCAVKKNGSISLDEWNMFYMSFTYNAENKQQDDTSECNDYESEELDSIDSNNSCKFKNVLNNLVHDIEIIDNHNKIELTYEEYEEESFLF